MTALQTDLYQLTMSAGYFGARKANEHGTFELFVRRLPEQRRFLVAAGLAQAVEYLLNLRFTGEQIDYLRKLPPLAVAADGFWEYLRNFRFTGDLFAMPEGTPFFAGEPVLIVRAPLIEAQIPETFLLSCMGFESMIAAKAARVSAAAQGRTVVEFGARRAHGPEAGVLAARAAYIGGCDGTSNVEAGYRYGVPVYGTSAHSWVLAFESETEAFAELQKLLGPLTYYLIDSYDTIAAAHKVVKLGKPVAGVRLDSGDLVELSKKVRTILDNGGLTEVKIMVTSDLNEDRIAEMLAAGAPVDVFGVGTELATSHDAPSLSAVYKIAEHESEGRIRYTSKRSTDKKTWPGAKQVFRFANHDLIACSGECVDGSEALLRPVILDGQLVEPLPTAAEARERFLNSRTADSHTVTYSAELNKLAQIWRTP